MLCGLLSGHVCHLASLLHHQKEGDEGKGRGREEKTTKNDLT